MLTRNFFQILSQCRLHDGLQVAGFDLQINVHVLSSFLHSAHHMRIV